jgi:hypothetical protein
MRARVTYRGASRRDPAEPGREPPIRVGAPDRRVRGSSPDSWSPARWSPAPGDGVPGSARLRNRCAVSPHRGGKDVGFGRQPEAGLHNCAAQDGQAQRAGKPSHEAKVGITQGEAKRSPDASFSPRELTPSRRQVGLRTGNRTTDEATRPRPKPGPPTIGRPASWCRNGAEKCLGVRASVHRRPRRVAKLQVSGRAHLRRHPARSGTRLGTNGPGFKSRQPDNQSARVSRSPAHGRANRGPSRSGAAQCGGSRLRPRTLGPGPDRRPRSGEADGLPAPAADARLRPPARVRYLDAGGMLRPPIGTSILSNHPRSR